MGAFLECKVDPNFKKLEVSEEIQNENPKKDNQRSTPKALKPENKNKNNIKTEDIKEDEIIINTDEEPSDVKKKIETKLNSNIKGAKKKISNTIYINNSNVTISNRNNKEEENEDKLKDLSNHEIKNEFNCFNSNEENIELDELLNKVFNNNIKTNMTDSNNKNLLTESEIGKEYFGQLYSEQSQCNMNTKSRNENDAKIINKLKEIKDKINNKNSNNNANNNSFNKKKNSKYSSEYQTLKSNQMSKSMNNRQIRKNIPTYRRQMKSNNYNFVLNSFTFDKNFRKFKKLNYSSYGNGCFSLENSFNKSLCSSFLGKSVREPFYYTGQDSNSYNTFKKNNPGKRTRDTPGRFSMHQSYINNSSLFNMSSSNGLNSQYNNNKEKRLYNIVSKNIILNNNNKSRAKSNKNITKSRLKRKMINIDLDKENNSKNNNKLFYHQYRDIIEVDLPIVYNNESFINDKLAESNLNNKIILNYNKLNNFNTSIILYDGILYKVIDKKNKGFKLSKRYFQITKNCFRYYNDITNAKNDNNKALVQFDIRHIKDIQIINHDFLNGIDIDEKNIEFVFCIYLYQNDDFFVFAVFDENYGNSVFNVINLLKNYYEDKK